MEHNFQSAAALIHGELGTCLSSIDDAQVQALVDAINRAEKVFVVGVGRVMLMLQAFVKRLNHLGVEAFYVGEINEPAITDKDLLIVASGSGESAVPVVITKVAQKHNPTIAYIGSNVHSTVAKAADLTLRIPCRTKLGLEDELPSRQPMSSLFEQSLLLVCDGIAQMMVCQQQIEIHTLWKKHANLE